MIDIKQESRGKWAGIYNLLGIEVGTGKHTACPMCGGKDRFRCDGLENDGEYICNQCGAGDGISLVMKSLGLDFMAAKAKILDIIGANNFKALEPKKINIDRVKYTLNNIWKESKKLISSDPVMRYLRSRGILYKPTDVRFCEQCYESSTKKKLPAMVALIRDDEGTPVSIFRTYLDGIAKAKIESPKKIMTGIKPLKGSAIRLFPLFKDILGIAEGIETAMSARQLWDIPVWAAIGTSLLQSFIPPEGIKKIVVFGDNDGNFAGQKAAYTLANKLYLSDYSVSVEIPDIDGDFNDILQKDSKLLGK